MKAIKLSWRLFKVLVVMFSELVFRVKLSFERKFQASVTMVNLFFKDGYKESFQCPKWFSRLLHAAGSLPYNLSYCVLKECRRDQK